MSGPSGVLGRAAVSACGPDPDKVECRRRARVGDGRVGCLCS